MSFLYPEFLYYMLLPLVVFFGFLLTKKEQQATFFSKEVMEKLRVNGGSLTLRSRNILFMLVSLLTLIALSGPVIDEGKIEIKAKSADIMIALDISDSMLAADVYPNRLNLAKQKALELLKLAPNERIGVIGFAKNSYLVSPLSFDHNAVGFLLRQLDTNSITEKGTNLLSMLEVVDKNLNKEAKKYLLILSDGGDESDFFKEIEFAKEHNIAIFILGVGTLKGAPIKKEDGTFIQQNGTVIVSKLNENIADLATKTGGVYIQNVNSTDDIKAMLREIEAHSEKKELKSQEINRYIPLFYYPLGLAIFILLLATSSRYKRSINHVVALAVLTLFLSPDAKAGLLDFMKLDEAKKAYENKEYEKSQKIYDEYAKTSNSPQSYYNNANALYKEGKYKEARESYEKAKFEDKSLEAKNLANLGNAYAKEPNAENLKKAVEVYENSLKLEEDKDTRENLEAVKKAIKEQEKKNQDKNDKNKDDKKKNDKDKEDKKNEDSKDSDKSDGKGDKSDKDKKEKSDKKSDEEKSDEKKSDEEKKKSEQEKKKDETKELKDENSTAQQNQANESQDKMSDEEEKKWLQQLDKQQSTYLYRLNEQNKVEEDENEKPW